MPSAVAATSSRPSTSPSIWPTASATGAEPRALVATMNGVFADNDAAPAGSDTHVQGDLTNATNRRGIGRVLHDFIAWFWPF